MGDRKSMVLEAVCDHRLRIYHAFFGTPSLNNDINVVQNSPLMDAFNQGELSSKGFSYESNDESHAIPYFLADGIYPKYAIFAIAVRELNTAAECKYNKGQERVHKDIECAFGNLKMRFQILKEPSRLHIENTMYQIMYCCIIIHNTIIDSQDVPSDVASDAHPVLEHSAYRGQHANKLKLTYVTERHISSFVKV